MRCFERCFSFFNDAMFWRCFKKFQNIVQPMHLTMSIAHPYRRWSSLLILCGISDEPRHRLHRGKWIVNIKRKLRSWFKTFTNLKISKTWRSMHYLNSDRAHILRRSTQIGGNCSWNLCKLEEEDLRLNTFEGLLPRILTKAFKVWIIQHQTLITWGRVWTLCSLVTG